MQVFTKSAEIKNTPSLKKGITGFVPTMGALHEGHLSLVGKCRNECDTVAVSIFVNPTQFNDKNDLKNYPRTLDADLALLEKAGVDLVFAPSEAEMYPEPDNRVFDLGGLDTVMEGPLRPGHFNGVAQVVTKLFSIVEPQRAYFGEKDFQQLAIIRYLVKSLDLPIEIIGCPIRRGEDGLALSSRNVLLTPEHRAAAPQIYAALCKGVEMMDKASVNEVINTVRNAIDNNPWLSTEYFEIVDAASLRSIRQWSDAPHIQGCVAVRAGEIRLIDNIRFK